MVAFSSLGWASVTVLLSIFIDTIVAQDTSLVKDDLSLIDSQLGERANSVIAFSGITSGFNGNTPPQRKDFVAFTKDPIQLNLFLLALQRLQSVSESDPASYTQLAKIHALPIGVWDSVTSPPGANSGTGYCTHNSPLFPLWHRPYMALFEKALWNQVQAVHNAHVAIGDFRYAPYAASFRLPYWDWAKDQTLPAIIGLKRTVRVNMISPSTHRVVARTIDNPLYTYKTQELGPSGNTRTLRNPNWTNNGMEVNPDDAALNQKLANLQATSPWSTRYYNAITNRKTYKDFRTEMESIHNDVHNQVGSGGQFTSPAWASFDPIFWLHHANVDRLISIWQKIYPNSWIAGDESTDGTYGIPQGQATDQTALSPFHQVPGKYWTSRAIYNTAALGYVYPETDIPASLTNPADVAKWVWAKVNTVYQSDFQKSLRGLSQTSVQKRGSGSSSSSTTSTASSTSSVEGHFPTLIATLANSTLTASNRSHTAPTTSQYGGLTEANLKPYYDGLVTNGTYNEYVCDVSVNTGALGKSYAVHFFTGETPTGSMCDKWVLEPSWIGYYAVFGGTNMDMTVTGQVPLTHGLLKQIVDGNAHLDKVNNANIMIYLKEKLQWAVCTADMKSVAAADCPGLTISVAATNVDLSTQEYVLPPAWGNSTNLHESEQGWNPVVYNHIDKDTPNSVVQQYATVPAPVVVQPTEAYVAPTQPQYTVTATDFGYPTVTEAPNSDVGKVTTLSTVTASAVPTQVGTPGYTQVAGTPSLITYGGPAATASPVATSSTTASGAASAPSAFQGAGAIVSPIQSLLLATAGMVAYLLTM